ncbi:hypothetical protein M2232_004573 [Bradyrhizobium japonicum]|nr:hypothetical protein [Bradyrhizobium japonicum]MCS3960082.1 hypothetical protein [Bradyrhizobium japonicum]MCS4001835.1 hypothetical protein [Bradyrhizobium japonicum]MCW2221041.1 hypothetical protein [Bradyrhizobium japonicum]MCW2345653.1 hypothetical protein [Bradyrhizobium japonicum]
MRGGDDEAKIGFRDEVRKRQPVSAISTRRLCRKPQMASDQYVGRALVPVLLPAARELLFLLLLEQIEALDSRGVFALVSLRPRGVERIPIILNDRHGMI